ncbi:MAG: glutaredoxin 3 [Sphingomicrobium sp.]
MPTVEIYTKQFCGFCARAINLLGAKAVQVEEIPIDGNMQLRAVMIERANGRTTVPQIFIRGEHIGGCNELVRLEQQGILDGMLVG